MILKKNSSEIANEIKEEIKQTKFSLKNLNFTEDDKKELNAKLNDIRFISSISSLDLEKKIPKQVKNAKLNLDFNVRNYENVNSNWNYDIENKFGNEITTLNEDIESKLISK